MTTACKKAFNFAVVSTLILVQISAMPHSRDTRNEDATIASATLELRKSSDVTEKVMVSFISFEYLRVLN